VLASGDDDFDFDWIGRAPFIPGEKPEDGFSIASFSDHALAGLREFWIRIVAEDGAGDRHTLTAQTLEKLPYKTVRRLSTKHPLNDL